MDLLLLAFLIGLLAGLVWHRCTCNKAEIEAERDELKGKLAAALARRRGRRGRVRRVR